MHEPDELLAAGGEGRGTPPVRIGSGAVLNPVSCRNLLIDEHGLGEQMTAAVDEDDVGAAGRSRAPRLSSSD